jgi:hypothetical protein
LTLTNPEGCVISHYSILSDLENSFQALAEF